MNSERKTNIVGFIFAGIFFGIPLLVASGFFEATAHDFAIVALGLIVFFLLARGK